MNFGVRGAGWCRSAWYNLQDMSTDAARLAYVHTLVKMDPSFLESLLKSLGEGRKGGGPGGPVFSCLADGGEDEGADADAPVGTLWRPCLIPCVLESVVRFELSALLCFDAGELGSRAS